MITAHIWQSTLFASAAGLLTLALKEESGADAVSGVVHRIGEVSGSVWGCWVSSGRALPVCSTMDARRTSVIVEPELLICDG